MGFGVLFNVPKRTVTHIFIFGFLGVGVKFGCLAIGMGIIAATLAGASVIGILSLPGSYHRRVPALVLSIPSVIPMVPGMYIYRMMVGIIELHGTPAATFEETAIQTIGNGLNAAFVCMALSVGVSVPNLILRKDTFNELRTRGKSKG